ncbi:MAG: DegT/DnrJ/EryC1/StrS family aminotransferase [Actinomycetota bacterium]
MTNDSTTTGHKRLSLAQVRVGAEEEELVLRVLRSGHLAQGPMVAHLEAEFARLCGVREAIAVGSGTTALVAALTGLGVGPGDEVVTAPITFGATLNAILQTGARARFVDVLDDGTMDPEALEQSLRLRPAKVVLPVHIYGRSSAMDSIEAVASSTGAAIVEDAAQAVGATCGGRAAGSFGVGCFSLYATKNITSGEGGMITTDDESLADRIRLLRGQGMRDRYEYEAVGYNWRMTDLQAAVGIPQLARVTDVNRARQANAQRLSEGLAGLPGIVTPEAGNGRTHVFHQYTVRVTGDCPVGRDELMAALQVRGIDAARIYPRLVFDYPCYLSDERVEAALLPRAARLIDEVLSLPVHPGLGVEDVDRIATEIADAVGARRPQTS